MKKELTLQESKKLLERHNEWMREKILNNYQHEKITQALDIAIQCLEDSITPKLEKCYNCYEMVKMVSTGEICPKCKC